MFSGIETDKDFHDISTKNNLKWIVVEGDYKNSLVEIGWYQKKKTFARKTIPMANTDFDLLTSGISNTLMESNDYSVFREILILQQLETIFLHYPWKPHLQTSFISIVDEKPFMNLILDYVGSPLSTFFNNNRHLFERYKYSLLFQIFVQIILLDSVSIHHHDLHWNNIVVISVPKPFRFSFQGVSCNVYYLATIIDYGCALKNASISNFDQFLRFLQHMPQYRSLQQIKTPQQFLKIISTLI
jgi:hypothetical protein